MLACIDQAQQRRARQIARALVVRKINQGGALVFADRHPDEPIYCGLCGGLVFCQQFVAFRIAVAAPRHNVRARMSVADRERPVAGVGIWHVPHTLMPLDQHSRNGRSAASSRDSHGALTHGVVTLTDTKNGDTRYVPLSPFARDALRRWLAGRPMRGRIFSVTAGAMTRAFARARDRARLQYESLCKQHGRRPVRAYFVDLRLHDLRHEATTMLSDVYPAHALAKVTGHRDTRMLMRYYNPRGRDLAQQLMRSKLGRWQSEQLRLAA